MGQFPTAPSSTYGPVEERKVLFSKSLFDHFCKQSCCSQLKALTIKRVNNAAHLQRVTESNRRIHPSVLP
jgi:hypothetical protein